ncbi:hypothetical protein G155_00127 [Mycobacterium sp. VKM Ac-1817D]|nr:hypothetical protein G155_00127 [Mycobacterium sp. VKM Ac-1817D]
MSVLSLQSAPLLVGPLAPIRSATCRCPRERWQGGYPNDRAGPPRRHRSPGVS